MISSPLADVPVFMLGPVPIKAQVLTSWAIMLVLALLCRAVQSHLKAFEQAPGRMPGRLQILAESLVDTLRQQIRETMQLEPTPYLPLMTGLFVYILCANLSALIPGVEAPTARIETDAALALIVFCSVIVYGVRERGLWGYLKSFAEPHLMMVPLNLIESFTHAFSLMLRLFGNMMSGAFVMAILLSLAGLLVPIPFMALDLLVGAIQAYIFTVLAMVFVGAAVADEQPSSTT